MPVREPVEEVQPARTAYKCELKCMLDFDPARFCTLQAQSDLDTLTAGKSALEVIDMLMNPRPDPNKLPEPSDFGLSLQQTMPPTLESFGLTMPPQHGQSEEEDYDISSSDDNDFYSFREEETADLLEYNQYVVHKAHAELNRESLYALKGDEVYDEAFEGEGEDGGHLEEGCDLKPGEYDPAEDYKSTVDQ